MEKIKTYIEEAAKGFVQNFNGLESDSEKIEVAKVMFYRVIIDNHKTIILELENTLDNNSLSLKERINDHKEFIMHLEEQLEEI